MKISLKIFKKLIYIIVDALNVTQVSLGSKDGKLPLSSCPDTTCGPNCVSRTCDFRLSGRRVEVSITPGATTYPLICGIELIAYHSNCSKLSKSN
jgi:hypothetical protein